MAAVRRGDKKDHRREVRRNIQEDGPAILQPKKYGHTSMAQKVVMK